MDTLCALSEAADGSAAIESSRKANSLSADSPAKGDIRHTTGELPSQFPLRFDLHTYAKAALAVYWNPICN